VKFFILFFCLSFTTFAVEKIDVYGEKIEQLRLTEQHFVDSFDQKQLKPYGHLEELIQRTPGVMSAGGTNRARYFQIRGIGERSSYEGMPNESINIFLDEIDYTGFGNILNNRGIGKVEIYKGPQNTSAGAASLGGSISATSTIPKQNGSSMNLEVGNLNSREIGITQSLMGINSTTFNLSQSDGYIKNQFLNRADTNKREELTLKNKFKYKNYEWNVHFFDFNSGYDVFNLDNNKETFSDNPGQDNLRSMATSLIHTKRTSFGEFKSIGTISRFDSFYSYDEDWQNSNSYDYMIEFSKKMKTFTLEERFLWDAGHINNRTGVYFKNDHQSSLEFGYNGGSPRKNLYASYKRHRAAIYHESEYEAESGLTYFAGGRLTSFSSSYADNNNIQVSPRENLWGGQIGVKGITDNGSWITRLAKGYKAGGVNIGTNIDADRREFEQESLYSLDLIYKYDNGFVGFDINAFYTYRDNIQVKTSFQDDPGDPSSFTFYNDNATSSKSYGLEWNLGLEASRFYSIRLGGNIMETAYSNYEYGERNLKDREFAYAPNYKISLAQQINFSEDFYIESKHIATDEFYFGNSHDELAPKSIVTDLFLNWRWLRLWTKNVFNERTETRGFFFGNRPPNYDDERFVHIGPPRTYGVNATMEF
jgi:iron complex outermembrane receptor protein